MYTVGIILSFKIALIITAFSIFLELRRTAQSFRKYGLSDYAIKIFYMENIASSFTHTCQISLALGAVLSTISTCIIFIIDQVK